MSPLRRAKGTAATYLHTFFRAKGTSARVPSWKTILEPNRTERKVMPIARDSFVIARALGQTGNYAAICG